MPREGAAASPLLPHKLEDMKTVCKAVRSSLSLLEGLVVGGGVPFCLKILSLEVFQENDRLVIMGGKSLELGEFDTQVHGRVMGYVLDSPPSLLTPYLLDWARMVLGEAGENPEQVQMIVDSKLVEKVMGMLLESRQNNILASKLAEVFVTLFGNIDREMAWAIHQHKNTAPHLITFPLFSAIFAQLPLLHEKTAGFKQFNDPLFTTLLRVYMVMNNCSRNMLEILFHHSALEACQLPQQQVMQLIDFYEQTQCFKWFAQHITMKELGRDQIIAQGNDNQPPPV